MAEEELKTLVLASKEVNSHYTGLEIYNVVALCTPSHAAQVLQIMQSSLDTAELIYICKEGQKCKTLPGTICT